MEDQKLFSTSEAATMLGTTAGALRLLIMRGVITPKLKIGRAWVFTQADIEELRTRQKNKGGRPPKQK